MNRSAREHPPTVSLRQRAERWRQAERRARRLARGRSEDAADATRLADDYRLLAHDLARVRTLMPDSRTREYLEAAYARARDTASRRLAYRQRTSEAVPRGDSGGGALARALHPVVDGNLRAGGERRLRIGVALPGAHRAVRLPRSDRQRGARPAVDGGVAEYRALLGAVGADSGEQHRREPVRLLRRVPVRTGHSLYPGTQRLDAGRGVRVREPARVGGGGDPGGLRLARSARAAVGARRDRRGLLAVHGRAAVRLAVWPARPA